MTPNILVSESRVQIRPDIRIWERTPKRQLDENRTLAKTITPTSGILQIGFLKLMTALAVTIVGSAFISFCYLKSIITKVDLTI